MEPEDERGPHRLRPLGRAAEWTAGVVLVGVTLLIAAARHAWLAELAASFRWQLGWCALAAGLVGLACRRQGFSALALTLGLWHVYPEGVLWLARPDLDRLEGGAAGRPTWVVATANLRWRNGDVEGVLAWVRDLDPDLLFVQEVSPHWRVALAELRPRYPHQVFSPEESWGSDEWGTAMLSRQPFERTAYIKPPVDGYRPLIEVGANLGGAAVTLRGMHPIRPAEPDAWRRRNTILSTMMEQDWDARSILLGDLNTTSGSPVFGDLLRATGLRDSRVGFGRQPSFMPPPKLPLVQVAIDHILVGEAFLVLERWTEVVPGSDHRAAAARIALAPPDGPAPR